jgi:dihydropteroate synthase
MGILNVTPDSFYDRGRFAGRDAALARAHELAREGAAVIDIGGQSYAHWNPRVAEDEERRRVVPVIEALVAEGLPVALSIDTYRAVVARAALEAGAHLINDCSGLSDPAMAVTVAEFDAALVVMHLKGELNVRAAEGYVYDDAPAEIVAFLRERIAAAHAAGVGTDAVIADPGLEFGKEPRTDLEILDRFDEFAALGTPLLLASSRKSFMGRIFDVPASELLGPSLATAALGYLAGARMFRVHDVATTVRFVGMLAAVRPERRETLALVAAMPR